MSEKSRILVFADTHASEEPDYDAVAEKASDLGVDSVIFAGDNDRYTGYESIAEIADVSLWGNHDYCWAGLARGQANFIPPDFETLAADERWHNSAPELLEAFTRFQVKHVFERVEIRHAIAPHLIGNPGPTDDEFMRSMPTKFNPQEFLRQQFWAAPTNETMHNGTSDPYDVLQKVFQYMQEQDQRLLVNGHEHLPPAIESSLPDNRIQIVPLRTGQRVENITAPSRLRIPAFCDTRQVVVLDISETQVDVELHRVCPTTSS